MRLITNFLALIVLSVFSIGIVGCGYLGSSEPDEEYIPFYDDPSFYMPGDAIPGGNFTFNQQVDLFVWDSSFGKFIKISQGMYIEPLEDTLLAIQVEPRTIMVDISSEDVLGGEGTYDQRVFVSDGSSDFVEEAFIDTKGEFDDDEVFDKQLPVYTCLLDITDKFPTYPILIEVLYEDWKAEKKKFIVETRKNFKPESNKLVREGIAVTVSQKMLDIMGPALITILDLNIDSSSMKFSPGDTGDTFVDIKMGGIPLLGININDTYDDNGKETRAMAIEITQELIDIPIFGDIINLFLQGLINMFSGSSGTSLTQVVGLPIDELLIGFLTAESAVGGDSTQLLEQLKPIIEAIEIGQNAFLNIHSMTEENTSGFAAMGVGLFLEPTTPDPELHWPIVEVDDTFNSSIDKIKKENTDLGIAISTYGLNHLFEQLAQTLIVTIPQELLGDFGSILKLSKGAKVGARLAFNPKGWVLETLETESSNDNSNLQLSISDMTFELLENGNPRLEASTDIPVQFRVALTDEGGDLILNLEIVPMYEECHLNLFEDTLNITFLDHANLVEALIDSLLGAAMFGDGDEESTALVIPLNLSDIFGITPGVGSNVEVKDGNCFLNLAVEEIDIEKLMGLMGDDACFISTSNFKY